MTGPGVVRWPLAALAAAALLVPIPPASAVAPIPTVPASVAPASIPSAGQPRPVLTLLRSLPVAPERPAGYSREQFADWRDADGDGCDTREEVLIAERLSGRVRGCTVVGGRWSSRYDGVVTRDPGAFDIDHRVALAEAWESGAWRWSPAARAAFANDLGYGPSLVAVSASSNRSKGDRDPAEWLPPRRGDRCSYARQWVAVKYRWRLAVDASERAALTRILAGCPSPIAVPPLARR